MRRQSKKHTLPILIILICSLVLGFVFELACTGVERLTSTWYGIWRIRLSGAYRK